MTRPSDRSAPLVSALEVEGAEVVRFPTIEVRGPADPEPLEDAAERLVRGGYDWVVLTSAAGVEALRELESRLGRPPAETRFACVGPSTAEAAAEAGWTVSLVPDRADGAALGRALVRALGLGGARVLFPRAEDAGLALPAILREAGAKVDDVVAYRKGVPEPAVPDLAERIERGDIHALTFTSPSTVRNFGLLLGAAAFSPALVAIGPTTAAAVEAVAGRRAVVAREPSVQGLVEAVVLATQERKQQG